MSTRTASGAIAGSYILVVDDSGDNCFLLQVLLEAEGYRVDVANDGFTALNKVKADPPDLVLLDVMMPDMNGFEVTRQIRQQQDIPDIPILLVTAHDRHVAAEGMLAGADGFVRKPIEFDELLGQVQSVLAKQSEAVRSFQPNAMGKLEQSERN